MTDPDPSSSNALRLILAGVGFWGQSWIRVIHTSPHWELVGLVDTDEAAVARAAAVAGIDTSACFESVTAADERIGGDAVLIAVPPRFHAPLALEALERGLHCLIEKPFASTLDEARSVIDCASSVNRTAMVNQQYRYRPGARTVATLLEPESLGRIGSVNVRFANELAVRGFQHEMEEPLLWDMAIHHFDLLRGILRLEPTRVQATSSNPTWSTFRGNSTATVVFETHDAVPITYTGTLSPRCGNTQWDGSWEIACENGAITWHADEVIVKSLERPLQARFEERVLRREWRGRRIAPARVAEPDRLGSLAELRAAIRERREPETSSRDNVRSLALTVAAVESARQRTAIDISDLFDFDGAFSTPPACG